MTKRLTEKQKGEIVKSFKSGKTIDSLSKKYNCTNTTIVRNLKKSLGDSKYKESLNISKSLEQKSRKNVNNDLLKIKFDNEDLIDDSINSKVLNENITSANFTPTDSFFEIAPIDYEVDDSSRKELSSISLSEVDFPKVVYMVVDKKIELEIKLLKDFPEWDFLPNDDLRKDSNKPKVLNGNITASNFAPIDAFFEIAPLDYEIDSSSRKELSSISLSEVDFPKVVYMVVDKKIELEIKLLKDFPEWDFLPNGDLNRKTIEIFFDLNLAKRSCNKEQKVLKVPNTDVFRIAAPVLLKKGISRIVCAENLIAL